MHLSSGRASLAPLFPLCSAGAPSAEADEGFGSFEQPRPSAASAQADGAPQLSSAMGGLRVDERPRRAEAAAEAEAEDDGAIPDIDDVEGEELMMAQPVEEEDAAALPPSGSAAAGAAQGSQYLKAEEPEDNIVKTSDTQRRTCEARPQCAAHTRPLTAALPAIDWSAVLHRRTYDLSITYDKSSSLTHLTAESLLRQIPASRHFC